jgi:hypothetical protein
MRNLAAYIYVPVQNHNLYSVQMIAPEDIDWRLLMNDWTDAQIRYVRDICNEKLSRTPIIERKALIRQFL